MRFRLFALSLLLVALPSQSRPVQSLQPLLLEALHYGEAQGVLVGPIAQTFVQIFRTSAPLVFRVQRVGELTPSCKRLEVTAEQDGVWDRNSTQVADRPEARRLVYQVSMCADGSSYTASEPRGGR